MERGKEFYAFISYKREDEKWAQWLQDKLEHYKFPTNLNGRTDLPKHIRPTFRDVTDSTPGLLAEEIDKALRNSEWLIVICSPRSAKSQWVCKEAQTFIDLGRADHIIPFVIEGTPFSNDPATECYPDALLSLTGSQELLAANINEMGRDAAAIKVVARMFNLRFDALWQRYRRDRRRRRTIKICVITAFALLATLFFSTFLKYYDKKVSEFCKTGIRVDDGLFNIQKKLIHYQKTAWLLSKETHSLLKSVFYEIDYSYQISPWPIVYTNQTKGGLIDQLNFNSDESLIAIGTGQSETSGILDYKKGDFMHLNRYASSIAYIPNRDSIITCGAGVYKYSSKGREYTKYEIDGYGMIVSPRGDCFVCKEENKLSVYRLTDGQKIVGKVFCSPILCYAYSYSGEYLAIATGDSVVSLMHPKTGAIILEQRFDYTVGAITAAQDEKSFYVSFNADSTQISIINLESSICNTQLFSTPRYYHTYHGDVLSYTTGEYLAYTNGRYFVLYNTRSRETFSTDIKTAFNSEMDAMTISPSGKNLCYAINGKVYVAELKENNRLQRFPIQKYGFTNVTGPTVAQMCSNDTTVVMAILKEKSETALGLFNLYTGEAGSKSFETTAPIWKIVPLPNNNHVAVALDENDGWSIIDFTDAKVFKRLASDTLTCSSTLMLSANQKYLIGVYKGLANWMDDDSRCVWSTLSYDCVDSVYVLSGPLQDGSHLYKNLGIYSYPGGEKLYSIPDNLFITNEIFDGLRMAYLDRGNIVLYDINNGRSRTIYIKKYCIGDANDYKLVGFKSGFAVLFNKRHLMMIDTESGDLLLQKTTTPYECITSASFFNNRPRILVTTNAALYIYDLIEFKQLVDDWENRLR